MLVADAAATPAVLLTALLAKQAFSEIMHESVALHRRGQSLAMRKLIKES